MRPDRQHMTLAITNDYQSYPEEVAERLIRAGDRISAAPFDLTLDQLVGSYSSVALRPRVKVPHLVALYRATEGAMRDSAVALRMGHRFSPHETLLYRKGSPYHRSVAGFCWKVTHFHLIHSAAGETRHTILKSWALGDGPEEEPRFSF